MSFANIENRQDVPKKQNDQNPLEKIRIFVRVNGTREIPYVLSKFLTPWGVQQLFDQREAMIIYEKYEKRGHAPCG